MNKDSRILVLGHKGLVGSAVVRELKKQGYENIAFGLRATGNRYDLRSGSETQMCFSILYYMYRYKSKELLFLLTIE